MVTGATTLSDPDLIPQTESKNSIHDSAKLNQPSHKKDFLVAKIINYRVKGKCRLHPIYLSYQTYRHLGGIYLFALSHRGIRRYRGTKTYIWWWGVG